MEEDSGLYERYLEVYDEEKDEDEIKEGLKDEFLKDEMNDLLSSLDIDVQASWTKDDMADQMLSVDFYEVVKSRLERSMEEEEVEEKEEEKEEPFSADRLIGGLGMDTTKYIKKFWKDMQDEVDKNLGDFRISPEKYLMEVEKMWEEQSQMVKKNIERLARTELPDEDVDRLKEVWNEFSEEMSFHLQEIPIEIELRRESIKDIMEEHTKKSREIIGDTERKMSDLYPLWFDMVNEIRNQLEEGRSRLEDKEEELYNTWDRFSEELTEELTEMAEDNPKAERFLEKWELISGKLDEKISKMPDKHDHIYRDFWESLGREKPRLARKIEELTEMTEIDYMDRIEKALEPIRTTYEKMIESKQKDEKIKALEDRIEELEKKLEER